MRVRYIGCFAHWMAGAVRILPRRFQLLEEQAGTFLLVMLRVRDPSNLVTQKRSPQRTKGDTQKGTKQTEADTTMGTTLGCSNFRSALSVHVVRGVLEKRRRTQAADPFMVEFHNRTPTKLDGGVSDLSGCRLSGGFRFWWCSVFRGS